MTVEDVLLRLARALTVRLAEKLAQAFSSMMRLAESMVTPETECLLYATYWFQPILWTGRPITACFGCGIQMAAFNKQKTDCNDKQRTVTRLPHGLHTIKGLRNVFCLESQRSL